MIASYLFGTLIVLFMVATLVAVARWSWVRSPLGDFWARRRIARLAASSLRALSDAQVETVRGLVDQGTEGGLQLAVVTLESLGPSEADLASIFSPAVLQVVAEKMSPTCWPLAIRAFGSVKPCLDAFAACLSQHLEAKSVPPFLDAGFMGHVFPNPAWQEPYRLLLENEFPRGFIAGLAPVLRKKIAMEDLNFNMIGSYFVYSFPFEVLTALSTEGAQVLADIPVQRKSQLPAPPFWEPYGSHLALYRITALSDDAAAALSRSQRDVLFGGLQSFPDTPGHVQLAKRLARQKHVVLGASVEVADAIAGILSGVTISAPNALPDILYCVLETEQDHNRKMFVLLGGGVPNILR